MAPDKDPGIQVLIPYKELLKLLETSKEVSELNKEIAHNRRLIGALRGQLFEVIEKIRTK